MTRSLAPVRSKIDVIKWNKPWSNWGPWMWGGMGSWGDGNGAGTGAGVAGGWIGG